MTFNNHISELVGNTPILKLNNYISKHQLEANIYAKLEFFNPAGSVKDRIAKAMLFKAIEDNILKPDSVIIEPTSGNTGIGLASLGTSLGYQVILTMPETMSIERRNLLKAYGAKVVLTPGSLGMNGAIAKAKELAKEISNAFIPSQFENTANPNIHYLTTGPEIYQQLEGKIDIFVAGIGTGGTISGVGKYLKEKNPTIEIVAIEPEGSPVLSKGISGPHMIQGIGAGFIPNTLNTDIYDQIITVSNESAFETSREIAKVEGTLVGISSGAALYGATLLAKQENNRNKNIVVLFPDTGERYLSTKLVIQD
ncbi:MAG: cysteine synthase A [Thomasclavelia sp.]|uniref:cysteine synthase A n=1 Tax=Thomasclavelia sp. TaxID=3025757 RepID=UPI0039A2FDF9